jgi:hypothetical protein
VSACPSVADADTICKGTCELARVLLWLCRRGPASLERAVAAKPLLSIFLTEGEAALARWNIALALLVGATFSIVTIIPGSTPGYAAERGGGVSGEGTGTKKYGDGTGSNSGGDSGVGTMMGATSFQPATKKHGDGTGDGDGAPTMMGATSFKPAIKQQ